MVIAHAFFLQVDALAPKRENADRGMERRLVAQLMSCMDSLSGEDGAKRKPVVVIGATSRPDSLDGALRRAGRFDREVSTILFQVLWWS